MSSRRIRSRRQSAGRPTSAARPTSWTTRRPSGSWTATSTSSPKAPGSCSARPSRVTPDGVPASQSRPPRRPDVTDSRAAAKISRLPGTRRRRPTTHEHPMTDLPDSAADGAANPSTPDAETPAGDPELAALVADASAGEAGSADTETPAGDPELAALVAD